MDSNMKIESVPCEYFIKKEGIDGVDIKSHYNLTARSEEFDCVVELEPIHDPSDKDANSKIEIKNILNKHYVKEEADADNLQSSSLQDNEEIKNEFEEKTCPTCDQTENKAEQNAEGSDSTDIKWAILDENHVEFKLESILDEEAIEDEIDEPDFLSFEDFNREQEDLDYKKNELNCDYNIIVKSVESQEKSKRHKCDKCSYQTENRTSFIRHKQTHEARFNRNLFYCSTCGGTYTTKTQLKQHMVLHMDPKDRPTYNCDVCNYKTIYKSIIKKHKLQHAIRKNPESAKSKKNQKMHKCDKCSYQTENNSCLRKHERTHKVRSDRDLFECATCGRTYTVKHSLEQHMLLHMDPKDRPTHNCDVCGYKTIYKSMMKKHNLIHATKENPESAKSKNNQLKQHMLLYMDPKDQPMYSCVLCDYKTTSKSLINKHKLNHAIGENPESAESKKNQKSHLNRSLFECSTCGQTCTTEVQLKQHVVLHMDAKDQPMYDCVLCDFKTTSKFIINMHKLKHAVKVNHKSAKPKKKRKRHQYKCDKCSYQTGTSVNLKRHEQTHKSRSDRDLFECATCGRTYTVKRTLEQHMLLHMDPKDRPTHNCDVCGYKTIYKSMMKRHKLIHVKSEKVGGCGLKMETQ